MVDSRSLWSLPPCRLRHGYPACSRVSSAKETTSAPAAPHAQAQRVVRASASRGIAPWPGTQRSACCRLSPVASPRLHSDRSSRRRQPPPHWGAGRPCCPHLEQVPEQVVAPVLAAHKDEQLAALVPLAQQLQQPQEALLLSADLHKLQVIVFGGGGWVGVGGEYAGFTRVLGSRFRVGMPRPRYTCRNCVCSTPRAPTFKASTGRVTPPTRHLAPPSCSPPV